jgi:DNA-binding NtrC family response regulator
MKILLIEDDRTARYALQRAIQAPGRDILEAVDGKDGLESIRNEMPDLVFLDLNMPEMDGLTLLAQLQSKPMERLPEIIVITANESIDTAVECIRRGASDFIAKPYRIDQIRAIVARTQQRTDLEKRVQSLQSQLDEVPSLGAMASLSPLMSRVFDQIRKAAVSNLAVLVRGESGTGKELVARELHARSHRSKGPFIAVNTAAVSESLIESELFGHVKGAFTGADRPREGVFRKAHGGTLFLDEIGDMPASVQTRLLRVLQEGTLTPVGSEEPVAVDVRVISATHQDLEAAMQDKLFRSDLYYRLRGIELQLPPLRARKEDVVYLANRFAPINCQFHETSMVAMLSHSWPGNVRELKQRVEGAAAMATEGMIMPTDLGLCVDRHSSEASNHFDEYFELPLTEAKQKLVERFERQAIERAMSLENHNITAAARRLGIHRQNLQQKLKDLET